VRLEIRRADAQSCRIYEGAPRGVCSTLKHLAKEELRVQAHWLRKKLGATLRGHRHPAMSDPRVFFAAERTLLAWVRTGITVIALGFVVARFGLFLRVLSSQLASSAPPYSSPGASTILGIFLTLLGTAAIIAAIVQFRAFVSTLSAEDLPAQRWPSMTITFALAIASCGVVLAIYLAQ
jgi:putative membrane protein